MPAAVHPHVGVERAAVVEAHEEVLAARLHRLDGAADEVGVLEGCEGAPPPHDATAADRARPVEAVARELVEAAGRYW